MKLIVADFDGTFFDNNYIKNIELINSIKNEYDFVIATGRNYNSLKKDLKINCKYYICNDGGYILDDKKNIVYRNDFDKTTSIEIINRIKKIPGRDYSIDNVYNINKNIIQDINKIIVKRNHINDLEIMKNIMNKIDDAYAYLSANVINISPKNSRKDIAIDELLKLNKYEKVIVVGNEINDYDMIKKYNGFLISPIKREKFKTIDSFLELKKEL